MKPVYQAIRKRIPYLSEDDLMYPHIEAAREMIETGLILSAAEAHTGKLE